MPCGTLLTPGTLVSGRFQLIRRVSAGGMGTVFQALDHRTGVHVALKVLHGQDATDIERFVREAAILAQLDHPNIVRYVAHGVTDNNEHYLAMEWLEGTDLSVRLLRGKLSDAETLTIIRQAVDALTCAHDHGTIHRDIKPSNLFLRDGDVERVAIVDFGIAGIAGFRRLTQTGVLLGTPGYMAPELVEGKVSHDPRSDIFSLGCVFYECLMGRPAFEGQSPMAVLAKLLFQEAPHIADRRPEIPEFDALVTRMLAKDPQQRPASLAEVAAELDKLPPSVIARAPVSAMPTTLPSGEPQRVPYPAAITLSEQRLVTVTLAGDLQAETSPLELLGGARRDLETALEPYGGHATPLAGGSLIITTWAPGTAHERAERAALCALALRERFPQVPIALVTGRGLVSARVVEGDVLDRGVRSLAATSPAMVSLDEATAGMLAERFHVERQGSLFALHGLAAVSDAASLLLGKPTQYVGRNREMAMLEGIFTGCISEPVASAVLVTAPAGAGKTRLRREFLERLRKRNEPITVLSGYAESLVGGSPFGVIADVIRRTAGIREGEPLEVRRKKLTARLGRTFRSPMLVRVAAFLGELISAPFPDENAVLMAARENAMLMGDAMRAAWEEWLIAECAVQSVLLVLEDLQWGDSATARLIDATLRNLRELPLMVLALARPEAQNDLLSAWAKRDVPVIRLGPLPTRASEKLVRDALGPEVEEQVVQRVVERAAGNPFYLEELIRAVAAGRDDVLPDSVLGTVEARLDAEGTEAKRVLRAASVFGDRFSEEGVAALLGGERYGEEAGRVLAALAARELVAPVGASGTEYVFCHALVREAAYAMLTEADRALGHRLAGDWHERTEHTDSFAMAEHFRRGGEPGRAVRWYRRAAEQALEANDLPAAIERCDFGLACGASGLERGGLRLVQAEANSWRGEYEQAEAQGLEAIERIEAGTSQWFRAVHQVINAASKLGGIDRVERWIEAAVSAEPARGARRAQIICLAMGPGYLMFGGKYAAADKLIATLDRIVAGELNALDAEVAALVHQMRGIRAFGEGDLGTGRERFAAALTSFEKAGDLRNACISRSNLGATLAELGDFEGAEDALRAALAGSERMGLHGITTAALCNLGHVMAQRGHLDEAWLLEQRAAEAFQKHGDPRMEGLARTYLARIALLSGDLLAAERSAREALDLLQVAPPLRPYAGALLGRALLGLGRTKEALGIARESFEALLNVGALDEGETLVRLVHAEALASTGATQQFTLAIAAARDHLLARASRICDPMWRERFLRGVPDNARTLTLAGEAEP